MPRGLKFRHRIGLLVALAALALTTVTAVTLILGRKNEEQLSGIETRYVPLLELDRDLKTIFHQIPHALEEAASAADETKLDEADALEKQLLQRIGAGARDIADNGGDPAALADELRRYYGLARALSAELVSGEPAARLAPQIEEMRRAQQSFAALLDGATSPDRRRLAALFATARAAQRTSLLIDIAVACVALAAMAFLSWRIIRRTVRSLHEVATGVERLARGELSQAIPVTSDDELGDLAREANRTAARLRDYREQGEREDWIKTGLAELTAELTGVLDPVALGGKAMRYLARYVGARAAAVYASDERGAFRLLEIWGASGLGLGTTPIETVARDPQVAVGPAADGSGQVLLVPLLHEDRALGALELALSEPPSERAIDLCGRIRRIVGVALRVAESHQRARALLVEAQRQAFAAETANKELEAFSYSVSHDLRTPLRGIDGFSQALLEDYSAELPAEGQDYLRRIRAAAQRMAELIDDLLELSRVTRAELRRERVDLSAMFTAIVAELRSADRERAVDVRVQGGVEAEVDPRLIRITLENLAGNAWKFTGKTSAPVIEFGALDRDGERVFYVRDNGAGFDMKYADRLFGAFQRLHSAKEFPGTGIGLATVQRIVGRHGGRIWVEAARDRGAHFQFTLPGPARGSST